MEAQGAYMLKDLIEFIIKELVSYPDQVIVVEKQENQALIFEVQINEDDRGRLIGKEGKTIKAVRALITAVESEHQKVSIEIVKPQNH
jgi:predicted RNA-binding protein YlqC (UPF0109 family)